EVEEQPAGREKQRGRFRVVSLQDGQVRIDQPLEVSPGLSTFHLRRNRDQYVLLTNDSGMNQEPNTRIIPINNNLPLVNGHCYAFDRLSGKPRWSKMIAHQSLQPGQPGELPVLLFALRTYR